LRTNLKLREYLKTFILQDFEELKIKLILGTF